MEHWTLHIVVHVEGLPGAAGTQTQTPAAVLSAAAPAADPRRNAEPAAVAGVAAAAEAAASPASATDKAVAPTASPGSQTGQAVVATATSPATDTEAAAPAAAASPASDAPAATGPGRRTTALQEPEPERIVRFPPLTVPGQPIWPRIQVHSHVEPRAPPGVEQEDSAVWDQAWSWQAWRQTWWRPGAWTEYDGEWTAAARLGLGQQRTRPGGSPRTGLWQCRLALDLGGRCFVAAGGLGQRFPSAARSGLHGAESGQQARPDPRADGPVPPSRGPCVRRRRKVCSASARLPRRCPSSRPSCPASLTPPSSFSRCRARRRRTGPTWRPRQRSVAPGWTRPRSVRAAARRQGWPSTNKLWRRS